MRWRLVFGARRQQQAENERNKDSAMNLLAAERQQQWTSHLSTQLTRERHQLLFPKFVTKQSFALLPRKVFASSTDRLIPTQPGRATSAAVLEAPETCVVHG